MGSVCTALEGAESKCFQFIEFPSEWGEPTPKRELGMKSKLVSNLLSSPASGEALFSLPAPPVVRSFQFIEFPSEWGVVLRLYGGKWKSVSNLLSSPASGEMLRKLNLSGHENVSNLLSSPASGELVIPPPFRNANRPVSNLLSSPASGESPSSTRTKV